MAAWFARAAGLSSPDDGKVRQRDEAGVSTNPGEDRAARRP
jgi:hypothetical protein